MAEMPEATVAVKYRWSHGIAFIVIDLIVNAVISLAVAHLFPLQPYRPFAFWVLFFALSQCDRVVRALKAAGGTHAL
jgi:hypothetical protein